MAMEQAVTVGVVRDFPQRPIVQCPSPEAKKLERFRGVAKNLVVNAMITLESMKRASEGAEYQENYHLLHHYLDYLKRFCEGRV